MDSIKYIGLGVHQHSLSVAVLNAEGKLVLQLVMATHAATIVDFVQGLRGSLPSAGVETITNCRARCYFCAGTNCSITAWRIRAGGSSPWARMKS